MAGEDDAYLQWVRKRTCCACEAIAPSHPHHHTHGRSDACLGCHKPHHGAGQGTRGKGTRAHDHDVMPLCWKHHRQFHDATGHFQGWSREQRRAWQDEQTQACQEAYFSPDLF
jgi:hypothetical protein